ncbi:MAG: glutathione S-transferase [Pseudomonadota bacterium]
MSDYTLYYWPIPFRGQPIRSVLAHVGASWQEADFEAIDALKSGPPAEQPIPHMAPPVLVDHGADITLAQMPAILTYLGGKHGLVPDASEKRAMTDKIIADSNDVLYEMTLYNGAQMWTDKKWKAFEPRLERWMTIYEATGRRFGIETDRGFMLGTETAGVADLTAAVLWDTMTRKLPSLRPVLERTAPCIAGLCARIAAMPQQQDLVAQSDAEYGDLWCAGQIEASLRGVLEDS